LLYYYYIHTTRDRPAAGTGGEEIFKIKLTAVVYYPAPARGQYKSAAVGGAPVQYCHNSNRHDGTSSAECLQRAIAAA